MAEQSLEQQIGILLRKLRWRLAVAESCTGGLVGHRLTNIPGSSDYFVGGIIAYSNEAKARLLGVSAETLVKYGAVSRQTVLEMAHGARIAFSADIAMSVSGIAGPGGGTPEKPVGLTWIGLSTQSDEEAWHFCWDGNRLDNKARSAQAVLEKLALYLQDRLAELQA